ncbi:hypothetical protein [Variovorax sp. J22R115]|uniref:hypothetical protein n=1 Tax=Variovorax sp. J22R115 TaxID=3053509 RepID=UPI002574DDA9|nr:hypothetical protein [Variovorax sp. J22R115]MDM0053537.1 hypothetical protein [Variovorax sp. J22R115]
MKSRNRPMLGLKIFDRATVTMAGVELPHRIRKGQFNLSRLRIAAQAAPAISKSGAFGLTGATRSQSRSAARKICTRAHPRTEGRSPRE